MATTLFVIMIAMLMTTTLVAMNRQSILFTAGANDRMAALEMAQSGLNRLIDRWGTDALYKTNLTYRDDDHRRGYDIEFGDDASQDVSINNLMNPLPNGNVPPGSARVIVTGFSGSVTKRIRCVVGKSLFPVNKPVSAANETVTIRGNLTLNGIKNPRDPVGVQPVKSGLHSNRSGTNSQPAMQTNGPGAAVHVEETSFFSAVKSNDEDGDFDTVLQSQLEDHADSLKRGADPIQLARNDVPAALAKAATTATELPIPAPPPGPTPELLPLIVTGDRILGANGETVTVGPIQLEEGANLYVRGSIETPLIRGQGNIVAGGNVTVTEGARMIFANAGVGLVAAGNIDFNGNVPNTSTIRTYTPARDAAERLTAAIENGFNPDATSDAREAVEDLIQEVQNAPGDPDPALLVSLQELRETIQLFHRLSEENPSDEAREDGVLIVEEGATLEVRTQRYEQFVENNRLTELTSETPTPGFGRGHFQGLAFASKDLKLGGLFRLIGGVEAGGSMQLGDGPQAQVELTYCEAYRNLCPAGLGSPYLVSYQEE